ncbi:MAG TPA: hypothetical protein VHC18_23460 [Amycolatopsis sp.]|nr:hypothetical protein [Amycolatopsis sp.]
MSGHALEIDDAAEPEALALWCENLPALRRRASAGRWSERLERAVQRVRDGGPALQACERFGLLPPAEADTTPSPDGAVRAPEGIPVVTVPGLDPLPPVGRGDYRCPRGRCLRRAERDDEGHPPVCTLFDHQPMLPSV